MLVCIIIIFNIIGIANIVYICFNFFVLYNLDLQTLTLYLQWINNDINISQISTCSGMHQEDTLGPSNKKSD